MTPDHLDVLDEADDPRLIPGIYNYCDRWCERCAFSDRCLNYRLMRAGPDPAPAAADHAPQEAVTRVIMQALGTALGRLRAFARAQNLLPSTPDSESAELARELHLRQQRLRADPLVAAAEAYAIQVLPIVDALAPVVRLRGDARAVGAVETISALTLSIPSKTYRAVSGAADPEFDAEDVGTDANGSVKVGRLLIARSIDAWRVLMEQGRAAADGVPARLVQALQELDADLAARFPRAMAFRRPGFDTEPGGVERLDHGTDVLA